MGKKPAESAVGKRTRTAAEKRQLLEALRGPQGTNPAVWSRLDFSELEQIRKVIDSVIAGKAQAEIAALQERIGELTKLTK